MLTPQQKQEAEKRLKMMSSEMQYEKKIKQTIKTNVKGINQLIASLKDDPKAQRNLLVQIMNKLAPKIIALQKLSKNFEDVEEKMKSDKDRMNKQKLFALEDKERIQLSIEQIKETVKRIQQTVKESVQDQANKRRKIEDDLEKSLGQIKDKIITFNKQSVEMETQNQTFRAKKKQIEQKMSTLQSEFKRKAEQKDEQVRKQKQDLMVRLQALQGQVSEVTQLNKELSTKQKANFDKKLSLYLKTKKFPEYSTSFQNSAKTIDQCKEQLFKGVQRMNEAKEMIDKYDKQSKQNSNTFLGELKKKTQKQAKIQAVKKQKQTVRDRIIGLQNKLKEQKNKPTQ